MSFLGVTFAGVDETADVEMLREIRSHYFTVEWGLRLAVEHQGRAPGFPGVAWIRKLRPELNLSAQLWGKNATDFLHGDDTELMVHYGEAWSLFQRIQINSTNGIDRVDLPALTRLLEKYPDKQVILRIRDLNLELADALVAQGVSCSTLFDQSEAPEGAQKRWPKGLKRFAGCGYAGGLGPDNIYKQLSPILNAAQGAERWWVEMDSSLRTTQHEQEVFSLANCKRAIREFDSFFLDYTI
ncbi:MAG: hypothetical protein WAM44_02015 [Chthoniobacterales bacterium]